MLNRTLQLVLIAACLSGGAQSSLAQSAAPTAITQGTPNVKRTVLQKVDVAGTNNEMIMAIVEVGAKIKLGRHTHPGTASGYVTEGEYTFWFDGQPPKTVKTGESITIPAGAIHDEGTDDAPAKLVVVYIVEKGKPLVSPVAK